jgi:hypothetical protein
MEYLFISHLPAGPSQPETRQVVLRLKSEKEDETSQIAAPIIHYFYKNVKILYGSIAWHHPGVILMKF